MKISNEDGVSVNAATRAAAIRTSQGRCTPRRDRDSEVDIEAEAVFKGRGKPMRYQDSWHEAESSKFSALRRGICLEHYITVPITQSTGAVGMEVTIGCVHAGTGRCLTPSAPICEAACSTKMKSVRERYHLTERSGVL